MIVKRYTPVIIEKTDVRNGFKVKGEIASVVEDKSGQYVNYFSFEELHKESADLRAQLSEARKQSDFMISNRIFVEYHEEDKEYAAMSCTCSTESGRPFVEIYGWGSTPQEAVEAAMETKGGE